jgi:hypothetical protein
VTPGGDFWQNAAAAMTLWLVLLVWCALALLLAPRVGRAISGRGADRGGLT